MPVSAFSSAFAVDNTSPAWLSLSRQASPSIMWIRALFLLLFCTLLPACAEDKSVRLRAIGDYFAKQSIAGTVSSLADSRSVPDVVRVGPTLPRVLAEMRAELQSGYHVETQRGDAFGEGGEVTHSIILHTAHDAICLRMRYDSSLDRFHIVGYSAAPPERSQKP